MTPKFPVLSAREVLRVLAKAGFRVVGRRGSHIRLKDAGKRIVVVPNHAEIARGTMHAILAQAGLSRDDFLELMSR